MQKRAFSAVTSIDCFFLSQRLLLFDRKEGNSRPASHSVVQEAWCEAGCGLPRASGACLSPVFLQTILEATVALSAIAHDSKRTLLAFPYTPGSILCLLRRPCDSSLFSVPVGVNRQHSGQTGVLTDIMKLLSYGQDGELKGPETRSPQARSTLLQSHIALWPLTLPSSVVTCESQHTKERQPSLPVASCECGHPLRIPCKHLLQPDEW